MRCEVVVGSVNTKGKGAAKKKSKIGADRCTTGAIHQLFLIIVQVNAFLRSISCSWFKKKACRLVVTSFL